MNKIKQLLAAGLMVGLCALPLLAGDMNTPGLEPTPTPTPEEVVVTNSAQSTTISDEILEVITTLIVAAVS